MLNSFRRSIRRYSILTFQLVIVLVGLALFYLTNWWISEVMLILAALIGFISGLTKSLDVLRHGYYGIFLLQLTAILFALYLRQPQAAAVVGLVLLVEQPFVGKNMSSLFKSKHAPLIKTLDIVSLPFTVFIVLIAGILWIITKDADRFLTIVASASTAPLLLAAPLIYKYRLKKLNADNIHINTSRTLELLANAKTIVLRKSGVLTDKQITVSKIYNFGKSTKTHVVQIAGALALESNHPLAQSIIAYASDHQKIDKAKHSTSIIGQGIVGRKKGSDLLMGRYTFLKERGVTMPDKELSDPGILAYVSENNVCIGAIVFNEQEKPGIRNLQNKLKKLGFTSIQVVSGGSKAATAAIAKAANISKSSGDVLAADIIGMLHEDINHPLVFVGSDEQDETIFPQADVAISTDPASVAAPVMISEYAPLKLLELFASVKKAHKKAQVLVIFSLALTLLFVLLSAAGFLAPLYASLTNFGITLLVLILSRDLIEK